MIGVRWNIVGFVFDQVSEGIGAAMSERTYKRLRMQLKLAGRLPARAALPPGYRWLPWRSLLTERHAQVKWRAFREDLDGRVFSCLSRADGCLSLMREIAAQKTFCPQASWMMTWQPEPDWPPADVGTIQGILRNGAVGAIQNIGVVPEHRGQGLGRALLVQALHGFAENGMAIASLEVTAENEVAVRLYEDLGFVTTEVLYRRGGTGEQVFPEDSGYFDTGHS